MDFILSNIVKEIPLEIEDDDYIENGIVYCGKCHTPKQINVTLLGEDKIVNCLCKCKSDERDKEYQKIREEKRRSIIERLIRRCFSNGTSKNMKNWNFNNDNEEQSEISRKCRKYSEKFERFFKNGTGLLLWGEKGTGKTFYACCIANQLLMKGYSVIFTNFSEIANDLFAAVNKSEYLNDLANCALLIIDDFNIERKTDYMNEIVYNVIDTRYRSGKPLIITTNTNANYFFNEDVTIPESRIYSRLSEMVIPFKVEGANKRIANAKKKMMEDFNILMDS